MSETGDWRYVYASVPGVAHLAGNIECQDACGAALLPVPDAGPVLVLAVADGAGSATHARAGAELACRTLLAECTVRLADSGALDWTPTAAETLLQSVRTALTQRAVDAGLPVREFACTLLGAVVAADQALFLQIGDGAIVVATGEGYRPVFWPQTGEYANETRFVTDPDAADHLERLILTEPVAEIALLSDGLQLLALHYHQRQAHAPFFRPLFQHLRAHPEPGCPEALAAALERFLVSPAVNQRTHDDKTLILATRLPPPAAVAPTVEPVTAASPPVPAEPGAVSTTETAVARPDSATSASPVRESHGDEAV